MTFKDLSVAFPNLSLPDPLPELHNIFPLQLSDPTPPSWPGQTPTWWAAATPTTMTPSGGSASSTSATTGPAATWWEDPCIGS